MSSSKKEVILGTAIVIIISLWLINVGLSITELDMLDLLSLSPSLNHIISLLVTIFAVFGIGSGLWIISQSDKPEIKNWIERYTLRAKIPSYFLYVLVPLVMGLLLMLVLGQTAWGLGLACLSVLSTLVFLILGLQKNSES